jgi:hypothetical protein
MKTLPRLFFPYGCKFKPVFSSAVLALTLSLSLPLATMADPPLLFDESTAENEKTEVIRGGSQVLRSRRIHINVDQLWKLFDRKKVIAALKDKPPFADKVPIRGETVINLLSSIRYTMVWESVALVRTTSSGKPIYAFDLKGDLVEGDKSVSVPPRNTITITEDNKVNGSIFRSTREHYVFECYFGNDECLVRETAGPSGKEFENDTQPITESDPDLAYESDVVANNVAPAPDNQSEIDILVLFTKSARDLSGGLGVIQNRIDQVFNRDSPTILSNSAIQTRFRHVNTLMIDYDETALSVTGGQRLSAANNYLINDPFIRKLRDEHGADLVQLWINPGTPPENDGTCGVSRLPSPPQVRSSANTGTTTSGAFSTVSAYGSCVTDRDVYSSQHEIGHQLGAFHQAGQNSSTLFFPFAAPHPRGNTGTVMFQGTIIDPRIPYFSNPSVTYNGLSVGVANSQDHARVFNNTAGVVANYRLRRLPLTDPQCSASPSAAPAPTSNSLQTATPTTKIESISQTVLASSTLLPSSEAFSLSNEEKAPLTLPTSFSLQLKNLRSLPKSRSLGSSTLRNGVSTQIQLLKPFETLANTSTTSFAITAGQSLFEFLTNSCFDCVAAPTLTVLNTPPSSTVTYTPNPIPNNGTFKVQLQTVPSLAASTTYNLIFRTTFYLPPYYCGRTSGNCPYPVDNNRQLTVNPTPIRRLTPGQAVGSTNNVGEPAFDIAPLQQPAQGIFSISPNPALPQGVSVFFKEENPAGQQTVPANSVTSLRAFANISAPIPQSNPATINVKVTVDGITTDPYQPLYLEVRPLELPQRLCEVRPTITSLTQSGSKILIAGNGINTVQSVAFGNVVTQDILVKADNLLEVTLPPGVTAGSSVSVTTSGGSVTGGSFSFRRNNTDYDGDGRSDLVVWRPSDAIWYTFPGNIGPFGEVGDVPVSADFDGDGKSDRAVWRPSSGTWFWLNSSNGQFLQRQFGATGDVPVPGDYDRDGKTDTAVWRPSDGIWYIWQSSTNSVRTSLRWGEIGDIAVPGDYDGDGKTDTAVWRPSDGIWYIWQSSTNSVRTSLRWGEIGDIAVPGDYDGDGKTDFAVFRPSTNSWYIWQSSTNSARPTALHGGQGDVPVPGDFDGDSRTDFAVWRPSNGMWYVSRSTGGEIEQQWGLAGDIPLTSITPQKSSGVAWNLLPGGATDIGVGPEGSVWVIGNVPEPGGYGIYYWNGSSWVKVEGGAVRISVGPGGQPWVVNNNGDVYKRFNNAWTTVPGVRARDIGVGANGAVWVIGYDPYLVAGNYGIFVLNGNTWNQTDGAATRIAVSPDGLPWVVETNGGIFRRKSNNTWLYVTSNGLDISVGAEGTPWIVTKTYASSGGNQPAYFDGTIFRSIDGGINNIAVAPNGLPWATTNGGGIFVRR